MDGILAGFLALFNMSFYSTDFNADVEKPTWSCKDLTWVQKPEVSNGKFKGAAEVVCIFEAKAKTGFSALRGYLVEKTEKSKKVHSGPKDETYQKQESIYYDITREELFGEDKIEVRADVHLATDLEKKLIYDVFSKSINATGYAGLIKKLDLKTNLNVTDKEHVYQLILNIAAEVKKPALVPAGAFRDGLKKQIEKNAPNVERGVREEIQNQI
ncbi:MAG: hypothetical protein KA715_01095 [Xanthomonadaceae bacterium]|nr:hypothetical protein [Xanthomonadaceae bacterium]